MIKVLNFKEISILANKLNLDSKKNQYFHNTRLYLDWEKIQQRHENQKEAVAIAIAVA